MGECGDVGVWRCVMYGNVGGVWRCGNVGRVGSRGAEV